MKKKEISLKFSAVALAVLLASCGGGGSDGYYNQNENTTGGGSGTDNGIEGVDTDTWNKMASGFNMMEKTK